MNEKVKVLAINTGSTSTKVAVFEGEEKIFSVNLSHDADKLDSFHEMSEQQVYRNEMIVKELEKEGFALDSFDAFVARGGGLNPCDGGTYLVNQRMLEDVSTDAVHPATLGPGIVDAFAQRYGKKAYVVNPPDVDELEPVARVTGLSDVFRESRFHALSHKEVGLRAAKKLGKRYEDANLVIAHIGGGISVAAHKKGRAIDATDILYGDCPMAPTRVGMIAPVRLISLCFKEGASAAELKKLFIKNGGVVNHLGTSDILEVKKRIEDGDTYAELIYEAMIYQIGKHIGSFATVLHGDVDAIVLTGGISQDTNLVEKLKEMVGYIADFIVFPGELEMEALGNGALRVLQGREDALEYTGETKWKGFEDYL